MDNKTNFEMKVGVFVFVGLVVFTYIVFSIGDFYVFKPGYRIKVKFGFVDGIQSSAPVRYAGVSVGKLENIRFSYNDQKKKTEVELRGWVSKDVKIEKDAQAYINALGVVGEKYMEILPGTKESGFMEDGDELIGNDPVPMQKISQKAYAIADSLQALTKDINAGKGTLGKLVTDDAVYKNLEEFTADIKAHPWKLLIKGKEEPPKKEELLKKEELPKKER